MGKQDEYPIKVLLSKILPTVFTYSVRPFSPRKSMLKLLVIFREGRILPLNQNVGGSWKWELRQAVFQSQAHRLKNDLKEEISLLCQPAANPQQRGQGVEKSKGITSASSSGNVLGEQGREFALHLPESELTEDLPSWSCQPGTPPDQKTYRKKEMQKKFGICYVPAK